MPKAGNARTGPLPLHPMSVADILDGAFKLFRVNARQLAVITAVIVLPLTVIQAFLQRDSFLGGQSFGSFVNDPSVVSNQAAGGNNRQVLTSLAAGLVGIFVAPFVAGAVAKLVSASYLGQQETAGVALRATVGRIFPLFFAWILIHIGEVFGGVFCILPGLLLMAMWCLTSPAIVIEHLGPVAGMRRSWRLVKPRLWPTLGVCLLVGLVASMLGNVLALIPQVGAIAIGTHNGWILIAIGGAAGQFVTGSVVAIAATLQYFDARIRQEGFDLQLLASAL